MNALYLQVKNGAHSWEVLGLADGALANVKSAYRKLAIQLHPDKCSPELRPLHTALFQRLQDAYETLSTTGQPNCYRSTHATAEDETESESEPESESGYTSPPTPDQRFETLQELHRRNLDFQAERRAQREWEEKWKSIEREAEREAERERVSHLEGKRAARRREKEAVDRRLAGERAKRDAAAQAKPPDKAAKRVDEIFEEEEEGMGSEESPDDWEVEADRMAGD
ncbi:hypothetical protein LTR53_004155 [Teratosphaeriaceae sp. CCFEE 6253]|nr:hypothetical protein LTR53_004155 [Teratosphaeriaceae sp. CCFEE 6253]